MTEPRTFSFVTHWQVPSVENDADVAAFWQREGALGADIKTDERLRQVVLHARTADGEIAGVCTAVPVTLPRLGQPMYYYRCFIGQRWRKSRLVFKILLRAFDLLQDFAQSQNYPCIGMLLELENPRFGETLDAPVWKSTQFVYIGKSQRDLDLRVRYFDGARLKRVRKNGA